MKLKWTDKEIKYFNKKIPVEANHDWVIWAILALCSFAGLAYLFFGGTK